LPQMPPGGLLLRRALAPLLLPAPSRGIALSGRGGGERLQRGRPLLHLARLAGPLKGPSAAHVLVRAVVVDASGGGGDAFLVIWF